MDDDSDTSAKDRVTTLVQRSLKARSVSQTLSSEDALREVGLSSLEIVRLVVLVEDEFMLRIPIKEITTANFRSISAIARLISKLHSLG
jgi:acyl carrier protein